MPKKDELVEDAKLAIDEVFGDTSVPKQKTIERLEELTSHIEASISCLKEDIARDEEGGEGA